MNHWGWMVDRLDDNWRWMVHSSWLDDNWGWVIHNRLVDNWSTMVHWCWHMDHRGSMVNWAMGRAMSRSMHCNGLLLSSIWIVNILGSSMWLAGNNSCIGSVGLVNGMAHSWSITMLDGLMVSLVSRGSSQKGRNSNKYLKNEVINVFSSVFLPNILCFPTFIFDVAYWTST